MDCISLHQVLFFRSTVYATSSGWRVKRSFEAEDRSKQYSIVRSIIEHVLHTMPRKHLKSSLNPHRPSRERHERLSGL